MPPLGHPGRPALIESLLDDALGVSTQASELTGMGDLIHRSSGDCSPDFPRRDTTVRGKGPGHSHWGVDTSRLAGAGRTRSFQ